jgi:HEAT repeat protein
MLQMKRMILRTVLAAAVIACALPSAHAQQKKPQLPAELKQKIDKLLTDLASETFKTREAADKELRKLTGQPKNFTGVFSYLWKTMEGSKDAEVKTRLERIAKSCLKVTGVTARWRTVHINRDKAIRALVDIGTAKAAEALIEQIPNEFRQGGKPLERHEQVMKLARGLRKIGGPAVEPLCKALGHENGIIRMTAASTLGYIGNPKAVAHLGQALSDQQASVQVEAARALGRIGDSKAVRPLLKALKKGRPADQIVIKALGEIRDKKAVPALVEKLADSRASTRKAAERALMEIGRPGLIMLEQALQKEKDEEKKKKIRQVIEQIKQKIDKLLADLGSDKYKTREAADRELRRILTRESEDFAPTFSQLWKHMEATKDPEVKVRLERMLKRCLELDSPTRESHLQHHRNRDLAIRALTEIGTARAAEALLEHLPEALSRPPDKIDRHSEAMELTIPLVKIGSPAVEPLCNALKHDDHSVRRAAARMLGEIKDTKAVNPLLKALSDQISSVREEAALALGHIRDRTAVEPLIKALKDTTTSTLPPKAAKALGEIGDARAMQPLLEALDSKNMGVRREAAGALGGIGDRKATEPLIRTLRDESYTVRGAAVRSLGKLKDRKAAGPLIGMLKDSSVRPQTAEALGEIGDPSATDPLIKLLDDVRDGVRWEAAEALGKIGDKRAVEPLIKKLNDKHHYVRCSAVWALGRLKDERAVEPLIERLWDSYATGRSAAVEALLKIGKPALEGLRAALAAEKDEWKKKKLKAIIEKIGK